MGCVINPLLKSELLLTKFSIMTVKLNELTLGPCVRQFLFPGMFFYDPMCTKLSATYTEILSVEVKWLYENIAM